VYTVLFLDTWIASGMRYHFNNPFTLNDMKLLVVLGVQNASMFQVFQVF